MSGVRNQGFFVDVIGVFSVDETVDAGPFPGFVEFVVGEKSLNTNQCFGRKVVDVDDAAGFVVVGQYRQDFLVVAFFVFHQESADNVDGLVGVSGYFGGFGQDQDIEFVAVVGARPGNEPVGEWVDVGRRQDTVEFEGLRFVIVFVFVVGPFLDFDKYVDGEVHSVAYSYHRATFYMCFRE